MKKLVLTVLFMLTGGLFFAKPQPVPEWVQNYRKVYPNSEYLAQRGSGDSAEKARTDATAAISRYFQTSVNANLSTTLSSVTTDDSIEEKTVVVDEVNVQSQVEFFGLEYTEPFYLKSEKKWYCVVYMNRADAWQQYKPQIDIRKNTFNGLYKNLQKETDYFSKLTLCKKAWNSGKELLEKLEYGRIISPEGEASYQNERDAIAEIPVIFEEAKQNCSIYLNVESDYNKVISASLTKAFAASGFTVEKDSGKANYTAEVLVEENISGANPLSIKPSISLKVISTSGKSVFSYELQAGEKTIGYTLESAQKKAYPKLTQELQDAVKKNLDGFLKL